MIQARALRSLSSRTLLVGFTLALALSATAAPALAQAPAPSGDAKAEAVRKYEAGSKAFAEKRYKDAIDLFLEADSFVPNADLAYNTSLAYEAMGDASSALSWAREYLRRAPQADDRAQVDKRIDALERRLEAKGVQQVSVLSSPPGATVLIDDRPVGVTPWTGDLRPGKHRVELRLTGHQRTEQVFDLRPDRALDVKIDLAREEAAPIVTPPTPTPTRVEAPVAPGPVVEEGMSPAVPAGIAVLGAGAATFGAALGLELARASAEDDALNAEFQVDAAEHLATMEDLQLGARIAVGVGSGLVLAGGVMLVVGLASGGAEAPEMGDVSAACSGDGCAFGWRGSF